MIRKLLIIVLFSVIHTVYAEDPVNCPGLFSINAVGVENVSFVEGEWASYIYRNNFDTRHDWSFSIYGFSAKDEADAFKQANESIFQLMVIDGPNRNGNFWSCAYFGNDGLFAIATTLPL